MPSVASVNKAWLLSSMTNLEGGILSEVRVQSYFLVSQSKGKKKSW